MSNPPPIDQPDDRLREAVGSQYEIVRLLGVGGMGRVWLARDRTLERDVAIKVVAEELGANPTYRQRFLREARTVARLRHDGIVAVHAAGESHGLLFYVMELVRGQSLRERLGKGGRLPAEEAVPIVADVARALGAAHSRGVIHRDVKPENILLDAETGRAMVTDFGVAQALASEDDGRMTATGMVVGSPRYMSPEQAVGDRDLDGRSDLYALGLVAYEILSGSEPFEATSAGALLAKRLTSDPAPLRERAPEVPVAVAEVVTRALSRERDSRWASGEAFAAALEAALEGRDPDEAVAASGFPGRTAAGRVVRSGGGTSSGGVSALRRWVGRRGIVAMVGVLVLIIAAAGAWSLTRDEARPRHRTMLVLPFEVIGADPELEWLREGSVSMLTLDLAHWEDLRVVDYARTLDLLRTEGLADAARIGLNDARKLARATNANAFVLGRIEPSGDSLTLVAGIYGLSREEPFARFTESAADTADPRELFDRLARDLLQLSGAPEITPSLAQSTTPSLRAYRDYLAGIRYLNQWQLDSADRSFGRAIARDSGFALAYYKRALATGWRALNDSLGVAYARSAVANAGRLPPRDRALVEAYLALSVGLDAARRGDAGTAGEQLREARQRYENILSRDSLDAEAWYGLGDAHFHSTNLGGTQLESFQAALSAFDRTLALDSTFHLAYQHKLNIYQLAATPGMGFLLDGDSIIATSAIDPDSVRIRAARERAATLTVREARQWVDADPDASAAHRTLAQAYATAEDYSAAAGTIRRALARAAVAEPDMRYELAVYELAAGRPIEAMSALAEARRLAPLDSLRKDGSVNSPDALGGASSVALHAGRIREATELIEMSGELRPNVPAFEQAGFSLPQLWRTIAAFGGVAAGMPWSSAKPVVDSTIRAAANLPDAFAGGLTIELPMLAAVLSKDHSYLESLPEDVRAKSDSTATFQVSRLLEAGDTARAERVAREFARGDTLSSRSLLQLSTEAELLTAVGDLRGALATYQAMRPRRFGLMNVDPGWAVLARSYARRAELHAALGERAQAIAAYEEFIRRWQDADPELQPQVREARARLGQLRDAAPLRSVGGAT